MVAENTDKFLTVKGIELKPGMKMKEMLKKLESKGCKRKEGFDYIRRKEGLYYLSGSYFSHSDCTIWVYPIPSNKKIVGAVGVFLPNTKSFKKLKKYYDDLKEALSEKYSLFECQEGFDDSDVE